MKPFTDQTSATILIWYFCIGSNRSIQQTVRLWMHISPPLCYFFSAYKHCYMKHVLARIFHSYICKSFVGHHCEILPVIMVFCLIKWTIGCDYWRGLKWQLRRQTLKLLIWKNYARISLSVTVTLLLIKYGKF